MISLIGVFAKMVYAIVIWKKSVRTKSMVARRAITP